MAFPIEPQNRLWAAIITNFLLNQRTNYELIPYAIGSARGFAEIILDPSINAGASTLVADSRRTVFKRQKAGIMPLDDLLSSKEITTVKLAQDDCEGYELEVMQSARRSLRDSVIRNWFIDLHSQQLNQQCHSIGEAEEHLSSCGYRKTLVNDIDVWSLE